MSEKRLFKIQKWVKVTNVSVQKERKILNRITTNSMGNGSLGSLRESHKL